MGDNYRPFFYNMTMNYEQNIPFYISKFKEYTWVAYESDHYIFHVERDSFAEKEIGFIKQKQENAYKKITTTLLLKNPDSKIMYYFYSSQEKKRSSLEMGGTGSLFIMNSPFTQCITKKTKWLVNTKIPTYFPWN